jgi:hypothetical protein
VAQQAAGAIWTLVRANVAQKGQDGGSAALLSIANKLREEPHNLFNLRPVDEVFKKVLGDPATAIRVCVMCRTAGCLACRVTANRGAPNVHTMLMFCGYMHRLLILVRAG